MAGSGRKVFAAGEVLRAADVDNYLMDQTVMRFAGTAARGSAIGSAVAKGMVSYLDDANAIQAYDGAVWNQLAYQSEIVPGAGMQLIKSQVVGTAVSSVNVTGVFSTTYDNYRIIYTGGLGSTTLYLQMKFGATTAGYYGSLYGVNYSDASATNANTNNGAIFNWLGGVSSSWAHVEVNVFQPFLAARTLVTSQHITPTAGRTYNGYIDNTTSYTDFTFTTSTGTITGGTIFVYGIKK